ncbi:hypothetical protein HY58_18810 [Flavihumibacter sp. ZG627]|nr:hypothetical protein HY58_18810 [Flavihumibacter sp. ZG627]
MFILISCKKNSTPVVTPPVPNIPNNPPGQFIISLESISWDTAKLNWTKSIDPDNDSVSYNIYLNDTLKVERYKELSYTFKNLREINSYRVKVVAVDSKSKENTQVINFTTKKYWLKFLMKVEYGPITGYSYQKTGQMVKANDGGYVIVGDSQLGNWPDGAISMFAIKIDSIGNKIWEQRYSYSGSPSENKIVNYKDGYIICGHNNLIKINNNGDLVWRKASNLPSEIINGITVSGDGSIYAVGLAPGSTPGITVMATLNKYDQNGNLLMAKSYSRSSREEFFDIKIESNNELIVLGATNEPDADFWVVKLSMDGTMIWEKTYYDIGSAFPKNIIITNEGNYVFTGYSYMSSGPYFYLQMVDSNGENKWAYFVYDNPTRGISVAETIDNSLIVTGGFQLDNSAQAAIYKFDKNGNKIWEKLYDEFSTFLFNKTVIPTSDGGYIINSQKSKTYNSSTETDQIYIFKTDDMGEFQ